MKDKILVLAGPTAVGKTELSIRLAKALNGEIVSTDSMQIYKGMDIGSAKITEEEMQGVKHHMLDVVEPDKAFSVADYKEMAEKAIKEGKFKDEIVPVMVPQRKGDPIVFDTDEDPMH